MLVRRTTLRLVMLSLVRTPLIVGKIDRKKLLILKYIYVYLVTPTPRLYIKVDIPETVFYV